MLHPHFKALRDCPPTMQSIEGYDFRIGSIRSLPHLHLRILHPKFWRQISL
jgi:hypothetical protein